MNRMKYLLLIAVFTVLSLGVILSGCQKVEPTITQFNVTGDQVNRLNIYAKEGQWIKGEWKPEDTVYSWWTDPGAGAYYPLDYMDQSIESRKVVAEPVPGSSRPLPKFLVNYGSDDGSVQIGKEEDWGAIRGAGRINIKCETTGIYSLCFMRSPNNSEYETSVIASYTVE